MPPLHFDAHFFEAFGLSIQEQSLLSSTPFVITLIAIFSAAAGVALTSLRALSRWLVPFGGGVLVGVGLFWVLPEIAEVLRHRSQNTTGIYAKVSLDALRGVARPWPVMGAGR